MRIMNSSQSKKLIEQVEFKNLLDNAILSNKQPTSDCCLISLEPLLKTSIRLSCGHAFNYSHLYEEVKRQKYNRFAYETPRLGDNQIKCPYCQTVHDYLNFLTLKLFIRVHFHLSLPCSKHLDWSISSTSLVNISGRLNLPMSLSQHLMLSVLQV